MDNDTNKEQETVMAENICVSHTVVDTLLPAQPSVHSSTTPLESMDVDMTAAQQPELTSASSTNEVPVDINADSPMGEVTQVTAASGAGSTDDRIDAALAGEDEKADGPREERAC